jgi:hypothetical protein
MQAQMQVKKISLATVLTGKNKKKTKTKTKNSKSKAKTKGGLSQRGLYYIILLYYIRIIYNNLS